MSDLGFEVDETQDPSLFERDLTGYDLIVIGWTQSTTTEDLSDRAEKRLHEAVLAGTGLAGWHGMAAAFRSSLQFSLLTGASFLDHPGGEGVPVPYRIEIVDRDHPATKDVPDFDIASEQYYMHLDPDVHVLAQSTFSGEHWPWVEGAKMPASFVRTWGERPRLLRQPGTRARRAPDPGGRAPGPPGPGVGSAPMSYADRPGDLEVRRCTRPMTMLWSVRGQLVARWRDG